MNIPRILCLGYKGDECWPCIQSPGNPQLLCGFFGKIVDSLTSTCTFVICVHVSGFCLCEKMSSSGFSLER